MLWREGARVPFGPYPPTAPRSGRSTGQKPPRRGALTRPWRRTDTAQGRADRPSRVRLPVPKCVRAPLVAYATHNARACVPSPRVALVFK